MIVFTSFSGQPFSLEISPLQLKHMYSVYKENSGIHSYHPDLFFLYLLSSFDAHNISHKNTCHMIICVEIDFSYFSFLHRFTAKLTSRFLWTHMRVLSLRVFSELRTTSFIESTRVACSESVSHNRVQVLSIPILLLACGRDWTCNFQICGENQWCPHSL